MLINCIKRLLNVWESSIGFALWDLFRYPGCDCTWTDLSWWRCSLHASKRLNSIRKLLKHKEITWINQALQKGDGIGTENLMWILNLNMDWAQLQNQFKPEAVDDRPKCYQPPITLEDWSVQDVSTYIRPSRRKKRVEDDSCRKPIACKGIVLLLINYFRAQIGLRAAKRRRTLKPVGHVACESKIGQFQVSVTIEQNILQLHVPMNDADRMQVVQSLNQLSKKYRLVILWKTPGVKRG